MTTKPAPYSLAMVCDWLPTFGGAEHVLWEWSTLWPNAPLFTTVVKKEAIGPLATHKDIRTSDLQWIYRLLNNHQVLLPFMPRVVESIDLSGYDVVLSSSHAVGKGIIPPSTAVHVCYCHTPMRYAWEMEEQYLNDFKIPRFLKPVLRWQLEKLRKWDLTTAKRTDYFIANSTETQARIKRIYKRDSVVLLPPVSNTFFAEPVVPMAERKPYYLALGRLVPYKRFDLLIEAANRQGFTLYIAGTGQDEQRLKAMAGSTVRFLDKVLQEDLEQLYANATAFLAPQYEDAGVVLLEAQACGTPVIAFGKGGALDTVINGTTGVHFAEQTVEGVLQGISLFTATTFDPNTIRAHAMQFNEDAYKKRLLECIEEARALYGRAGA